MSAVDGADQGGPQRPVRVSVPPRTGRGVYANLAVVGHSEHEFTLDLCQVQDDDGSGEVAAELVTRVHLPPTLVPSLLQALETNLDAYRRRFAATQDGDVQEAHG